MSSTLTGETARIVRFTFAQNATQGSFLPPAFSHLRTKPKWTPLWQEDRKFQEMALWSLASGSLGKCASHAGKLRPSQSGNSNKAMAARYEIDASALLCELCKVGLGSRSMSLKVNMFMHVPEDAGGARIVHTVQESRRHTTTLSFPATSKFFETIENV